MNVRTRLARWLVGYPYMHDPLFGKDGAFVVMRERGAVVTIRAKTFRLRSGIRLERAASFDVAEYGNRRWGRFVGTVDYR